MPLYDYICFDCGSTFEKLRRMSDDDSDLRCPNCGSSKLERQPSIFSARGCGSSGRFR